MTAAAEKDVLVFCFACDVHVRSPRRRRSRPSPAWFFGRKQAVRVKGREAARNGLALDTLRASGILSGRDGREGGRGPPPPFTCLALWDATISS